MNANRKHLHRSLAAITAALLVAAIVGVGGSALASPPPARGAQVKPTIVLVHGGWADASGWNAEVAALERLGYPVIAPANPLRDLASDSAYIRSILKTVTGPIVLVGHSYGGAVITNAAVGVPNVKALVYIAGFAPDTGESLAQLVTMNPGSEIMQNVIARNYPLAGGGEGTDLYLTEHGFETAFASDLPKLVADRMSAEQRPFSQDAFAAKSGPPAWKAIPAWYLVSTEDHAIPPKTQEFMAARAHAHTYYVAASHVLMISHPAETLKVTLAAARSVS
ncbi:MAG: alpha/beta hydrolase [Solirubrobacteraceae bacterium]